MADETKTPITDAEVESVQGGYGGWEQYAKGTFVNMGNYILYKIAPGDALSGIALRFGVTPSVAGGIVADAVLAFAQKYPQTEIKYLEASPVDLCKMLQNGIIEVAVLKTVGDIPQNVNLLCVQTAPTVAIYKPGAGLLDEGKKDTVTIKGRVEVTGTVNLILCDGATLIAWKGITVPKGATLNIYGQSAGTGRLTIEKPTTVRRTPL